MNDSQLGGGELCSHYPGLHVKWLPTTRSCAEGAIFKCLGDLVS